MRRRRHAAALTARYAAAADHFGAMPDQIGRLTDRQVAAVLFHPRDEHGSILSPQDAPPAGSVGGRDLCPYEQDVRGLGSLLLMGMIDRARHDELLAQLKAKHGRID